MKTTLQDSILSNAIKKKSDVCIITTSGFHMRGQITGFDEYVIQATIKQEKNSRTNNNVMIYKHAISTIEL